MPTLNWLTRREDEQTAGKVPYCLLVPHLTASVSRYTAQRDLADLVTRQLIEQVGIKGPGVYYVLTDRLRG